MATAAQIDANRRNAQLSTGPRTDEGKNRVRRNAIKHGLAAFTIVPVLPNEDPNGLEERINRYASSLQPGNEAQYDLVVQAAGLTLAIERGERIESAYLAGLVLQAGRERTQKPGAQQRKEVRQLGRKLLYIAGADPKYSTLPPWSDDPELLVIELEDSAEGCRWLLERWAQYRNLLDCQSKWEVPELLRFIRLQGKDVIESVYDPVLNSIFLAWDVLAQKFARESWKCFRNRWPMTHPAVNHILPWREIAPRPSDPAAAWAVLYGVVEQHVGRLKELLAENEAREAADDPAWADRAALETCPAFERHRRSQSAKRRELMRTLDTLCKMRKSELGSRNGEAVASGEWSVASESGRSGDRPMEAGGRAEAQNTEPLTEECSVAVVGQDSNPVIEDSTNDTIGILSHEGEGEGAGQCLTDGVASSQKAQNKPNLESKKDTETQEFKPETAKAEGRKQSQSTEAVASHEWRVASESEGNEPLPATAVPPLRRLDEPDSPGDGQMNGPTYRVAVDDLIQYGEFRTKQEWQLAAEVIALNPQLFGEVDSDLLAKIKAMADETEP